VEDAALLGHGGVFGASASVTLDHPEGVGDLEEAGALPFGCSTPRRGRSAPSPSDDL
jgi:hypothetical protein